jgi:hypothetical protein
MALTVERMAVWRLRAAEVDLERVVPCSVELVDVLIAGGWES